MPLDMSSVIGAVGSWVGSILAFILKRCVLDPMTARLAGRGRSTSLPPPLDSLSPQNDVVEQLKETNRLLRESISVKRETNDLLDRPDSSDALLRQSISVASAANVLLRRQITQNQRLMRQIVLESREANVHLRRQVVLLRQANESLVSHFLRTQDIMLTRQAIADMRRE